MIYGVLQVTSTIIFHFPPSHVVVTSFTTSTYLHNRSQVLWGNTRNTCMEMIFVLEKVRAGQTQDETQAIVLGLLFLGFKGSITNKTFFSGIVPNFNIDFFFFWSKVKNGFAMGVFICRMLHYLIFMNWTVLFTNQTVIFCNQYFFLYNRRQLYYFFLFFSFF